MTNSNSASLIKFATLSSIISVSLIIIVKLIGWWFTNSLTIVASLADSFLDIATSLVNFFAARYALQPPDKEHRFGHGKAEDIAVFFQSAFFVASGVFLIVVSIKRAIFPVVTENNLFGIYIMAFSIIITICLIAIQQYVIKKTNSLIVKADHLHYFTDLLSNMAVIIALYIGYKWQNNFVDPAFTALIAIYILYNAGHLMKHSFKNLMDHEFDDDEKEKILQMIKNNPEVMGIHNLKTRYAGNNPFIQFHLEMSGEMKLIEAHRITEDIENKIMELFPNADVIIHQDPR